MLSGIKAASLTAALIAYTRLLSPDAVIETLIL